MRSALRVCTLVLFIFKSNVHAAYIVGYGGYMQATLNTGLLPLAKHSTSYACGVRVSHMQCPIFVWDCGYTFHVNLCTAPSALIDFLRGAHSYLCTRLSDFVVAGPVFARVIVCVCESVLALSQASFRRNHTMWPSGCVTSYRIMGTATYRVRCQMASRDWAQFCVLWFTFPLDISFYCP